MSKLDLKSNNKEWGFFGTMQRNYDLTDGSTERIFSMVAHMLVSELKLPTSQVINFLDGRYGRHFADELSFHGAKAGLTDAQHITIVRKFIKSAEQRKWVFKEARSEAYMNERSI